MERDVVPRLFNEFTFFHSSREGLHTQLRTSMSKNTQLRKSYARGPSTTVFVYIC